ncbi:hypothetical protein JVT61DRAFT_15204 [Boletus reticuloceps]|uniref:Uncharacterized protein n=1 Tax=Boletus reticuloceps TaxID=495285 RepID=A0A8I3ACK6_9AGAM|nr:hypothetical protein JVT61DRAFT_15204 [Boletus reticuloceps]
MRVIALVSLVLALSVSSLPVSNAPGPADISKLGNKVKSTLNGAESTSNPATHGPSSRALPGAGTTVVTDKVEQVKGQLPGATNASPPGTSDPAGKVLGKVKGAASGSRRDTGATGVTNTLKGVVSGAPGTVKAPGGADGVTARGTTPTLPGNAGDAGAVLTKVQNGVTGVASKVEGAGNGAPGFASSSLKHSD